MKPGVRWLRSFHYAYEGIKYALGTQRNMKFHFFASFVAVLSALFFHVSRVEMLFVFLAITLVMITELVNTAIEKTVDLAMPKQHPLAKIAKDVAAAAVLVSAVFAAGVGAVVFFKPVERWFIGNSAGSHTITPESAILYVILVALTVIVMETRFSKSGTLRPSLWMAIAFSISTLITMLVTVPLVAVLAYLLSILFFIMMYQRTNRSFAALCFGAFLGILITTLAFYL